MSAPQVNEAERLVRFSTIGDDAHRFDTNVAPILLDTTVGTHQLIGLARTRVDRLRAICDIGRTWRSDFDNGEEVLMILITPIVEELDLLIEQAQESQLADQKGGDK